MKRIISIALGVLFVFIYIGILSNANQTGEVSTLGKYEGLREPEYKKVTTQSLYVTMRDGVKIAIDVVLPKGLPPEAEIPAIIQQTRYWRAIGFRWPLRWTRRTNNFQRFFTSYGYAIVLIDARGSGASFSTRPHPWSRDEIQDSCEIVDWIISQPWSNGKVGAIGTSYDGTSAELLAVCNHPAVKAVIPRFNEFDVYTDIAFPGGIFNEQFVKEWAYNNHILDSNNLQELLGFWGRLFVKGVKPVDADKKGELLKEAVKEHAKNTDVYQSSKDIIYRDDYNSEIKATIDDFSVHTFKEEIESSNAAIYSWGSWLDAGTADAVIRRFMTFSNTQRAVIGPWSHGASYHASPYLPADTPTDPRVQAQWLDCLRFFDYYLKDIDNGLLTKNILMYYTMGAEKWKETKVWPPANSAKVRWYMDVDRKLSSHKPAAESGDDTYKIDFGANTGKRNRWWTQLGGHDVVYPDRAEGDQRLLTYTSASFKEDVEITGYPVVTLYITSTATDGAFFVYLEDVDEAGKVIYITEGQLRALHRKVSEDTPPYTSFIPYHSYKKKDGMPLVPDEVAKLTFGLLPTSALIKKGHRIRIAIAGHDASIFTRIPARETPTIRVLRNKLYSSFIELPVIQK
jgi:putative CocE/NonD family hydrolase